MVRLSHSILLIALFFCSFFFRDVVAEEATSPKEQGITVPAKLQPILLALRPHEPFAIFTYQKHLWIVTTNSSALSLSILKQENPQFAGSMRQVETKNGQVFMVPISSGLHAFLGKTVDSSHVAIELLTEALPISDPLSGKIIKDSKGVSSIEFIIPSSNSLLPEQIVTFDDPYTGMQMEVLTLPSKGTAVANAHSFVEFTLLETAQGLVIQKPGKEIRLTMNKDNNILRVISDQGLAVSDEIVKNTDGGILGTNSATILFPYQDWKTTPADFLKKEDSLILNLSKSDSRTANKIRLRMVQLYLANGFFTEAEAMANNILRVSYQFFANNNVAALRGAAYFFRDRFEEAARDFSAKELANSPEAKMWLAFTKEMLGDGPHTFNFADNYPQFISQYPPIFIQKLAVLATDKSIARGDYESASATLDILERDHLNDPIKKITDYLHAQVLAETQNEATALQILENQSNEIDDPLIRARSGFSLINLKLRQHKMTTEVAAQRLEKLRVVWRGDTLELNILMLLGSIYLEENQYTNALRTFREIGRYYPQTPEAMATSQLMSQTFMKLFNEGGADSMQPVTALTLFYEFRDLVPSGKLGDEVVRKLADRLVDIDLLERASALLDHQIRKRLQGDERSRVGTRLALVYLFNRQAKEALDILKMTGYGDLPADVQLTRLRLTAQALAQLGENEKAINALSTDTSLEGMIMRLSIYWESKNWTNVITTAEDILSNRNDPSEPLNKKEAEVLLKLATAYVFEHDTGQIQYLRDYFTPLIRDAAMKENFLFITSESGTLDFENLAALNQDVDSVKSFIDNARKKAKNNALLAPVN